MSVPAVIDTNVIVSALLSKNDDAATVKVLDAVMDGEITPLYHEQILEEYMDVLHRGKFHFREETIKTVFAAIQYYGRKTTPLPTGKIFADMDDLIFYEVALRENAYLITGNKKHYPQEKFIVAPTQMLVIMEI